MADSYIEVTNEDFTEKVLQVSELVIVNFSADHSSSCQILEPELQAVSKLFEGRALFTRVNVENQPELTRQWNIEGIPTLLFLKSGKELHRIKGIMMRDKLRRQIEGVLLAD